MKAFFVSLWEKIKANPKITGVVVAAIVGVIVVLAIGGSIRGCIDKL
jgi:hypothetical protein